VSIIVGFVVSKLYPPSKEAQNIIERIDNG
jgi:hypothetical protein